MMSGSMKIVPANGGSPGVGTTDVVGAADGWSDVDEVDDGDPTPLHAEPAKAATKTDATILFMY